MTSKGATVKVIQSFQVPTKHHPYKSRQYHTRYCIFECGCGRWQYLRHCVGARKQSCSLSCANSVHGLSGGHPLYNVWHLMKSRCHVPTCSAYHRYGGRGIYVCETWKKDFMSFYKWAVSHGWKNGLTIERVNNNKGYSPSNCCFITRARQSRNRRSNKLNMEQVKTIRKLYDSGAMRNSELAKEYGITPTTMCKIVHHKLWKEDEL